MALAWGPYLRAEVYTLLRFAQSVAANAGMTLGPVGQFPAAVVTSLLFAFVVSIPVRLGFDPALAAMIVSAAGWTVAAFALLAAGQSVKRPRGALVAALLLCFNPAIFTTLGSPTSWLIALGWLAVALLLRRHILLATFTVILLVTLFLPWPLSSDWSHLTAYSGAIVWSILLFSAGVGADWLADELVARDFVHVTHAQMTTFLLVAVFIVLGTWQGLKLWQLAQERPQTWWQVEEEISSWLRTETGPGATLLANERTAYLAQRPTAALPDLSQLEAATAVQEQLQAFPVDYLVTSNVLPWQQLRESVWFRLAYEPQMEFDAPYLPQAPLTIWAYRQPLGNLGPRHTINARVPDRLWLLGYQIGPQQAQAGESVQMALTMQAPEATFEPPTPFQAIVRLISQYDNSTIEEWTVDLPQTISSDDWQANQVIVEDFPLTLPDDLQAGAYLLNLSLLGPASENLWPISLDNDYNQLDRVPIGQIIVPWEGDLQNIQPLEATIGPGIRLEGFTTSTAESGEALDVTLLWQAEQPIDKDYVVFVHVLNSDGKLVASHDGLPGNGRFPTSAWLPGITIPDTHSIALPPDLPAGDYLLKAGLYAPDTGQRLAATTAGGTILEDSAILLTTINWP